MEKLALITGSNSGIGFETAKGLLRNGYNIIMVCRSAGKGEHARKALLHHFPERNIDFYRCDLSNFQHVRKTIVLIKGKNDHLDLLINNAGYVPETIVITPEGHEKAFQACHLGHFILTNGLVSLLEKSPEARIINLSSVAHMMGNFDRIIHRPSNLSIWQAYGDAKLANLMFTIALAEKLKGSTITANAVHPGVVRSNFGHNLKGLFRFLVRVYSPFMITVEKGAQTSIYLATSEEVRGISGQYFAKSKPAKTRNKGITKENAQLLWEKSVEWTS